MVKRIDVEAIFGNGTPSTLAVEEKLPKLLGRCSVSRESAADSYHSNRDRPIPWNVDIATCHCKKICVEFLCSMIFSHREEIKTAFIRTM